MLAEENEQKHKKTKERKQQGSETERALNSHRNLGDN